MGTTPIYGLPYPEATDFVTDGAAAIQALAEETEDQLATGTAYDSDRLGGVAAPMYSTTAQANAAYVERAGVQSGAVGAAETTTSATFTDLATAGPAATVTVGASGTVLVILSAELLADTASAFIRMGYAISGATTAAASVAEDLHYARAAANLTTRFGITLIRAGLTPGSTTFTCKYSVSAGTGTFVDRRITVIPL